MVFGKKAVCGVLAGALLIAGAGCNSSTAPWVYRAGGYQPPIGVYLYHLIEASSEAEVKLQELHADEEGFELPQYKDVLKQDLEGQTVDSFMRSYAEKSARRYLAVEEKFDEMGLALEDGQKAYASNMAANSWANYQDLYEANGIAESSIYAVLENEFKRQIIFDKLYNTGGEREVPDSELREEFQSKYAKADLMAFPKGSDEENPAIKASAESYLKRLQAGENFYDLLYEKNQADAEDSSASEESASEASGAEADGESQETGTPEEAESAESDAEADGVSPEESTPEAPAGEEEAGGVERPEEGSQTIIVTEDMKNVYYSGELVDGLFAASVGSAALLEDGSYYYVAYRLDILEKQEDFDAYRNQVLSAYKMDEFDVTVEEWADAVSLEINEDTLKNYGPSRLKLD